MQAERKLRRRISISLAKWANRYAGSCPSPCWPLSSIKQIVDLNTVFHYSDMFDAMVDAAYYSMVALNFSGIPVVVTESGWPWFGGTNEPAATIENAEAYNNNRLWVLNNSGPPSQPSIPVSTYIYELFNEESQPGPVSKKNWACCNKWNCSVPFSFELFRYNF
ncbi:hypothetical protein IFM89_002443 [Coptis chinensis]|uniref:Glucan endo-1,3-beta-D-glucosidase n=1 Tax=Coptis chinensis TaxID=261450 RepID=A0A835INC7_9MAGN|nr:hypothetical protein IFM89_002443 [Coptis chinensis]